MSTFFDFIYNLTTESAQNAVLAAIAAAKKKEYEPISHFFTDASQLASPVVGNIGTDAFGPVLGSETTKYRTTSVVRTSGSNSVKVFAICDGQVLIQPQIGDDTKVNLILKPSTSYSPLKIKYFIYRGINKADLINANILKPVDNEDSSQPFFLRKLWEKFIAFNQPFYDEGIISTPPDTFPTFLIGYNESDSLSLSLEYYFSRKFNDNFYQIPTCSAGDHLGNFSGQIGLDVVLDYGDYELQNQEELFRLDLNFARLKEHIFDTATIPSSTATKIKRYKERIHQFIDPAAFWGSHVECGVIKLHDNASGIKTNTDIFNLIVSKHQTKNKIYVYIQGENNRSYNYYEATRKIFGFNTLGKLNDTSGWPILIEEITLATATTTFKEGKNIQLEYNIDSAIPELERHTTIDLISPNNVTSNYPLLTRPKNPSGTPPAVLIDKTPSSTILFPVNGTKSCATFLFIYANLKQEFPLKNYYNQLWPVNINTNLSLPSNEINLSSWCTYDKSRMVNLDEVSDLGASIQNKVVFDNGINQVIVGPNLPTKKRRLYMAVLKRNSVHDEEHDNLNIDTLTAGLAKHIKTNEEYALNLYNDKDFSIYKGTFTDGIDTINSLTLFHEKSLTKKESYFQLGITEEEYNKLIYDVAVLPELPPLPPQILPMDADNIFFHLEEDTSYTQEDIRKFKVGLSHENTTGIISTLFPTSPTNDIFVYTLDGLFFFSKEYSEFQEFYNEFANATVEFRTVPTFIPASGSLPAIPKYNGEFGFDWLRVSDNTEPAYKDSILGGYERPNGSDLNTEFEFDSVLGISTEAYKALKREYYSLPLQNIDKYYNIPYLNLFSEVFSNTITTSSITPPFEANLRVLVEINENLDKLEFDFDSKLFTIDKPVLSDKLTTLGKVESIDKTIKITCLNDFSEPQIIKILAYPIGVTDKKMAKLAGLILLNKNDIFSRKLSNIALISVHTDINNDGTKEIAQYMSDEIKNLYNILHQNLTYCNIIDSGLTLDLSNGLVYPDFKQTFDSLGNPITSGFINSNGGILRNNTITGKKIHTFLADLFTTTNPIYKDYFLIFAFDVKYESPTVLGHVDSIGEPLVVVYNPLSNTVIPRDLTTLNHETMHGYGLYHTHRDGPVGGINKPQIKYIYPYASGLPNPLSATDNVMSYLANAITLWQWQRKFINLK